MKLPPPGPDNATDIAEYVDRLVREACNNQRRQDAQVEWDRAINLYQGAHFTTASQEGAIRVVLNRILNCIVSQMAIQAGDPPKVLFTPRETGEPPLYFLNTKLPIAQQIIGGMPLGEQAWNEGDDPGQPLDDAAVEFLKGLIAQGQATQQMAASAGMPPPAGIVPPEILIEVSDRTAAESLQTIFDAQWEGHDCQLAFGENVLNKNIFGIQSTLYEFDDDLKRHILTNVHVKQVFYDPIRTDLNRMQYVIYDEPISSDEALSLYPWLKEDIDAHFKEGQPLRPGAGNYSPALQYQQAFLREMGYLRHAWIRSQPYPMTPEEAEAAGHISITEVPDEQLGLGEKDRTAGPRNQRPISAGSSSGDLGSQVSSGEHSVLETGSLGEEDQAGSPAMEAVPPLVPTRTAFIHGATGAELTPILPDGKPHPQWPNRYGIRQLRIIAGKCVDDRECEFADIPMPLNVNLPVPYSPYGMGEPDRLEGLQMALNYVLSAIVTHQRYNAYPPEVVAESIVAMMDEALKTCRSKPGQRISVPEAALQAVNYDVTKLITHLDAAAIPADFWKLLQFLVDTIDKEGNQSDVMSGNAAPGWSGDAIASLQNAASQVIKAKSMKTEFYLRDIARLMAHSIINRMGPADWAKYCSKYPIEAMEALHSKAKTLECDISVQIQSGSGAAKQSMTNNLIAARQNGVGISDPEIMERLGVDPDIQVSRQADYERHRQAAMPQLPAAAQPQPGAKGQAA